MTVGDILKATGGALLRGDEKTEIYGVCTDSRTVERGALFIALAGESFDGHSYVGAAFDKGAAAALVHKDTECAEGSTVILVKDTRLALGDIARYYRNRLDIIAVGLTGSVGKTTTKDMIYSVLSQKYSTYKTQGNFNNDIGVPKTVFGIAQDNEAAVIEMGMNHAGEIEYLSSIVRPDIMVITNIGESHIENLGSREGIFRAKMESVKLFGRDNVLIANGDDDFLRTVKQTAEYRVVYYGIKNPENDMYAKDIENDGLDGISFTLVYGGREYKAYVPVPGEHNVYNALAAVCAGAEAGVPVETALEGLKKFELTEMRMSVEKIGGVTVINDCYNASPDSIKAALRVLAKVQCRRRVAILGDILEMGEFAAGAHYRLGKETARNGVDLLITAGENAKRLADGAREAGVGTVISLDSTAEAAELVRREIRDGDAALIKASRGMRFEQVYNAVKETNKN